MSYHQDLHAFDSGKKCEVCGGSMLVDEKMDSWCENAFCGHSNDEKGAAEMTENYEEELALIDGLLMEIG